MTKPVSQIHSGDYIWAHGYRYQVTAVHYDPQGNACFGQTPRPRYIIVADALPNQHLPEVYAKGMQLGCLLDAEVAVDQEKIGGTE